MSPKMGRRQKGTFLGIAGGFSNPVLLWDYLKLTFLNLQLIFAQQNSISCSRKYPV